MNPFLFKFSKKIEGYDSLKTESSKDTSDSKKNGINSNSDNSSSKINEENSGSKITEFNSELPGNSCIEKLSEENINPKFRASFPLNPKEEKIKRCSKAFARFKKRYSAIIIEKEKKVRTSEKIKNIVAKLEKQMKGEYIEEEKEEEEIKFRDKRNTATQNGMLSMRKTLDIFHKKKGQGPSIVNIV